MIQWSVSVRARLAAGGGLKEGGVGRDRPWGGEAARLSSMPVSVLPTVMVLLFITAMRKQTL